MRGHGEGGGRCVVHVEGGRELVFDPGLESQVEESGIEGGREKRRVDVVVKGGGWWVRKVGGSAGPRRRAPFKLRVKTSKMLLVRLVECRFEKLVVVVAVVLLVLVLLVLVLVDEVVVGAHLVVVVAGGVGRGPSIHSSSLSLIERLHKAVSLSLSPAGWLLSIVGVYE